MVILTDEKFDYTPRQPLSPESKELISAKLLKKELPPVYFLPLASAARIQFCENCRRPMLLSEDRYCSPCEVMVVQHAQETSISGGELSIWTAFGIIAAIGLAVIWAALHLTK